mmetsp:Transcript_16706/g.25032  ORF Transcript_16706/g.25032 Transcript_16706/m.25032 type:complete len:613 (-) Transcript_16706:234-2072(-)
MGKKSKRTRAKQTGAIKPFVLFEQVWNQVTENGTIKDIDFVLRNENNLLRHLPSLEVTYPNRAARLYYILAMTIDYHEEHHFPPKSDPLTYGHRYRVENCTSPQIENALSYIQKAFALTEDPTDRNKFNGYRTYLIDFAKRISREDVLRNLYQQSFALGKFQEVDQEILVNYLKLKMQLDDYRGTIQIYNDNKKKIEFLLVSERLLIYLIVSESHESLNEYKKAIYLCEKRIALLREKVGAFSACSSLSEALSAVGRMYFRLGDDEKALTYLKDCLEQTSSANTESTERVKSHLPSIHGNIAAALTNMGREEEAIKMLKQAIEFSTGIHVQMARKGMKKHSLAKFDESHLNLYRQLCDVYTKIGKWGLALTTITEYFKVVRQLKMQDGHIIEWVVGEERLGKIYLERCFASDVVSSGGEPLLPRAKEWTDQALQNLKLVHTLELRKEKNTSLEANFYLEIAQQHFLSCKLERQSLEEREESRSSAHEYLKKYLDYQVTTLKTCCQACDRACTDDVSNLVCDRCLVARFCCEDHLAKSWKRGRVCHRYLCPLFKGWREVQKKRRKEDSMEELIDEFFEAIWAKSGAGKAIKKIKQEGGAWWGMVASEEDSVDI